MKTFSLFSLLILANACSQDSALDSGDVDKKNAAKAQQQAQSPEATQPSEQSYTSTTSTSGSLPSTVATSPHEEKNELSNSEPTLPEEAVAPAVVGGAFLSCSPTSADKMACFVADKDKKGLKFNDPGKAIFNFTPASGSASKITYTASQADNATMFLLDLSRTLKGKITFSHIETKLLTALYSTDEVKDTVTYAAVGTPGNFNQAYDEKHYFGDWDGKDGDGCKRNNSGSGTPVTGIIYLLSLPAQVKNFTVALNGMCGIQSTEHTVTMKKNGVVVKVVHLLPGYQTQTIFQGLTLDPGNYEWVLNTGNARLANGSLDDIGIDTASYSSDAGSGVFDFN